MLTPKRQYLILQVSNLNLTFFFQIHHPQHQVLQHSKEHFSFIIKAAVPLLGVCVCVFECVEHSDTNSKWPPVFSLGCFLSVFQCNIGFGAGAVNSRVSVS